MSIAQARPSLSILPPEILSLIIWMLRSEKDLVDVWTNTRHVSHAFRYAVDRMVRVHHLPRTQLIFNIGDSSNRNRESRTLSERIYMSFQYLTNDDHTRACFSQNDKCKGFVDSRAALSRLFKEPIEWCCPKQIVSVRRIINDTEVPGFKWCPENLGVSCNWRDLLTALLLEEKLYNTKLGEKSKSTYQALLKKLRALMDAGKIGIETMYQLGFSENHEKAYRDARRQRIAGQRIRDRDEPRSGPSCSREDFSLYELRKARFLLGLVEYSDDEEEEAEPIPKDDEDDELEEDMKEQFDDVEGSEDEATGSEHEGSGSEAMEAEPEAADNEAHAHGLASGTA